MIDLRGILLSFIGIILLLSLAGCRKKSPPPPPPEPRTGSVQQAPAPGNLLAPAPQPKRNAKAFKNLLVSLFDTDEMRVWEDMLRSAASEAMKELQSDPQTYIAAGTRAIDRGDAVTGELCFRRALQLDRDNHEALVHLGDALVKTSRYQQAAAVYEKILRLDQSDHVSRFNLAVVLSRLQRLDRAEHQYRRLLAVNEKHVQVWYNLATLYQVQGKLAAARDAWRKVISWAPDLPSAHSSLGEVLADLGDWDGAMAAYSHTAKLRPEDSEAWANLASASAAAGSFGRAILAMKKSLQLAPEDAKLWAQQGEIQLNLHRSTGEDKFLRAAIASWSRSAEIDPQRHDIRKRLQTYGRASQ